MSQTEFHGISFGWMQSQWRDCADKDEQLTIFEDMTGATADEIIAALDPHFIPKSVRKNKSKRWTPEEDATLLAMKAERYKESEIAVKLQRPNSAIHARYVTLRKGTIDAAESGGQGQNAETHAAEKKVAASESLKGLEKELRELKQKEDKLVENLRDVRGIMAAYRRKVVELVKITGGILR